MNEERVRLFVALELPADVRETLLQWRAQVLSNRPELRDALRLSTSEALHATLCFLGSQTLGAVDQIAAACERLAALPPARLALGDASWLPRRSPRVLAIELIDPDALLAQAQAELSRALSDGGWYVPEKRPFLAHVTVARVRRRAHPGAGSLIAPPATAFCGERVALFRSRLARDGARYEALRSVRLAG